MNKTRVISHNSTKHKACSSPSPCPSLCPDALSPASRTERLANSFRQAWDQSCIQAGSAPSAARSGRQTRATARKQPLLPAPAPSSPRAYHLTVLVGLLILQSVAQSGKCPEQAGDS
ncbi:hypothetical protein QQF64_032336 [Cirrhinus molitorella]|uniref:Uncharacterized protein n=1 Tax=Cirrhinus molitorella TaxID=172907 RepID=A0ABR3MZI5_9TELE